MKKILGVAVLVAALIGGSTIAAQAQIANAGNSANAQHPAAPMSVIFDTDLGNDIDDIIALDMLINYENQGRIRLDAITVCKSNPMALGAVKAYYELRGTGNPAYGFAYNGATPDAGQFLAPVCDALKATQVTSAEPAERTLRRVLAQSPDSSVVLIAVGPFTNIARLLQSGPDDLSPLTGRELARQKVASFTIMGGDIRPGANKEFNIYCDVPASAIMFEQWPGTIVASGWELGNAVLYPHQVIESLPAEHPLRIAYEHYLPTPYDRECWDETAVLHAIEPNDAYMSLLPPGRVKVDEIGRTLFTPDTSGNIRYLKLATDTLSNIIADRSRTR